jgi:hypothetical protein
MVKEEFALTEVPREAITQEPEPPGCHHDPHHQDVAWIGSHNQGGGHVPEDYEWTSIPRLRQELESMG